MVLAVALGVVKEVQYDTLGPMDEIGNLYMGVLLLVQFQNVKLLIFQGEDLKAFKYK